MLNMNTCYRLTMCKQMSSIFKDVVKVNKKLFTYISYVMDLALNNQQLICYKTSTEHILIFVVKTIHK